MDLEDYAETILFGRHLKDKLIAPTVMPAPAKAATLCSFPKLPGRPAALRFLEEGETRPKEAHFPNARQLQTEVARGRVMHFFANHELLALELMALMLLRFPDAPATFRTLLYATMRDEQKHLRLYLQRMAALEVDFGALPAGRFFWDCLSQVESPRHFLAGMSLTFEQANLDFSRHYLKVMADLDDQETREVLQVVYEDEIRHVRQGLASFCQDQSQGADLFIDYQAHLSFPMTPQHGKGKAFSRAARLAAGLPPEFVDEMEVFAASRGRPPKLWLFNPGYEAELVDPNTGETSFLRQLENDLGALVTFLAAPDDFVWLRQRPGLKFRQTWFVPVLNCLNILSTMFRVAAS